MEQQRGRHVLLQRRRTAATPIPSTVQPRTRQIHGDGDHIPVHVGIDTEIRPLPVHAGPAPGVVPQLIDDGVLHTLGAVVSVAEPGSAAHEVHRQRALRAQVRGPADGADAGIEPIRCVCREALERQQDPGGEPGPQADAVGHLQAAPEAHPRVAGPQVGRP